MFLSFAKGIEKPFATFAKKGLVNALKPLLELGENGLTMANLGFVNF